MLTRRFLAVSIAAAILAGCSGAAQVPNPGGLRLNEGAAWQPRLSATPHRPPFQGSNSAEVILHVFSGPPDGANPYAALIADKTGALYGTTTFGGYDRTSECLAGCGTVFRLKPSGSGYIETVLYRFKGGNDGSTPFGNLTLYKGALYGTTSSTVFKLTPKGSRYGENVLYKFQGGKNDGIHPVGGLLIDKDGAIYGTTENGGTYNKGTVFKLTPSGSRYTESILWVFKGHEHADGAYPTASLIADQSGALYSTTYGGYYGYGTVFKLTPSGSGYAESLLYAFQGYGDAHPHGGVIADGSGALYGTTNGCCSGDGSAFKLTPSQTGYTEDLLWQPGTGDGIFPDAGLIADANGVLYGTTTAGGTGSCGNFGCGTVFKLTPSGSNYAESVLYSFQGGTDGEDPEGSLIADKAGALYGTTFDGANPSCNSGYGCGMVFKIRQ